jgi:diguanylate cyclase (GGDEF)-like protein
VASVGGGPLAVALAMIAAYGSWQVFRWGGREHQALIGDLAFIPVNGAAILLAWRASQRADLGRDTCRAWRLLAVALLFYMAGDLLQLFYEVGLHQRDYPSWADVAYLGFYPVACYGLISFPVRRRTRPERLRLLLDTGIVFTGGAMLIWYAAIGPAISAADDFDALDLVIYAYPVGDVLLLFGILAVLLRGPPQSSVLALRVFAVGMVAYVAADLARDHLMAYSSYVGGDPVDTLWLLALVIMCLVAACQLRTPSTGVFVPPAKPALLRPSFLPYLAIVSSYLLLAIIGVHSIGFDSLGGGLLVGAVALAFLVSARQYIALHDYGRLAVRYQQLASVDGTTGLYNRRHFMEAADAAVTRTRQLRQPLLALMIDVDNFKHINDTHGHIAGDQVLAEIAHACREHVRPRDIVGRYGGDEFIILIEDITLPRATQIAGHLTRPAPRIPGRDGTPLTYTTSIGIADCHPACDLPALLTHADIAMYQAKHAGGGNWRIYTNTTAATQEATIQAAATPDR